MNRLAPDLALIRWAVWVGQLCSNLCRAGRPILVALVLTSTSQAQLFSGFDHLYFMSKQPITFTYLSLGSNTTYDAGSNLNLQLSENLNYRAMVLISSRDREWVGATFARPDLAVPFGTGRFFASELQYRNGNLAVRGGRLMPDYHPIRQIAGTGRETIAGDGVSLDYDWNRLSFQSSTQFLRNEKLDDVTINRIFNYHRIGYRFGDVAVGFGEFLLYTGHDRGIDWVWSNPFMPYVLHNYDYRSETVTAFDGDRDNTILYADLGLHVGNTITKARLYVDEFQVDEPDRRVRSDEILFHGQFIYMPINDNTTVPDELVLTISSATVGFGLHEGLFTDFFVGDYSLLPHVRGRTNLVQIASLWTFSKGHLILETGHSKHVETAHLSPTEVHLREIVDDLPREGDFELRTRFARRVFRNAIFQLEYLSGGSDRSAVLTLAYHY